MYYGGYYGMYWDPTYILVIIGMVICLLASARVKSTYAKFNRVRSHSGITAAEAAEKILHGAGIYDVEIRHISGDLTDNYDPSNRVLNLSDATFRSSSVAAIGVAAHECGHAIQDAESYAPLKIRGAIVPVVNFGATILLAAYFNRNRAWRKPYIDYAWCAVIFSYSNIPACHITSRV